MIKKNTSPLPKKKHIENIYNSFSPPHGHYNYSHFPGYVN